MSKKIRKPWCIYKGVLLNPLGIGEIVRKSGTDVIVRYSEKQHGLTETWDKKQIERFKTIKGAVKKLIKYPENKGKGRNKLIIEIVKQKFPSAFKKEDSA